MVMSLNPDNIERYTPRMEELLPFKRIKCTEPYCESVFSNHGNYEMHLERHHKLSLTKKPTQRLYYCPEEKCIYHAARHEGKHFKLMKYLRQHYQKVHMVKTHVCKDCGKAYISATQLMAHQQEMCGKRFACKECGWSYESMEALLTHGKRKKHDVRDLVSISKTVGKMAISPLKATAHPNKRSQQHTESNATTKTLRASGVQTDTTAIYTNEASNVMANDLDDIHSFLRDIETQTEPRVQEAATNVGFLDEMLAQPTHMYTQTCDDFLTELGLADIQTQTNWPSANSQALTGRQQYTSTATSTGCAHDELLVSTETQTSFTQCLLNSCTSTGTDATMGPFGSLCHTQHTQTSDPLLDDLFGVPDSDLIAGIQSTYTQT